MFGVEETPERRASDVDTERRQGQRREDAMDKGFWRGFFDNKVSAGLTIMLVAFAVTWFVSVSDAREKVNSHTELLAGQGQRIEQLERNEIRRTEEFKYINRQLDEILRKLDK
jgi:hypothetical protein